MLWLFLVGATWPVEVEFELEVEAVVEVEGAGLLFVLYKVPPIFDILYGLSIVER